MKQFLDLLRDIKENGVRKVSRTGVDTVGVVGRQLRFDLANGFPLVTTRPIYTRALIEELLFFIRGSTNNMELIEKKVHIWDKWMVPEDVTAREKVVDYNYNGDPVGYAIQSVVKVRKGELGPIYGAMWRRWPSSNGPIDQLAEAIKILRNTPFSRRIIVSAWNPEVLPDESKPPHQNASEGKQCLAACHTFFQLTVTPHRDPEGKTTKGRLHLHLYQRKQNCALAA